MFGHMDLNRSNRLVNETVDENGNQVKKICLIDFDYSCYGPREQDFCGFFCSYKHKDYIFGDEPWPTDEEMKIFLEAYRLESERLQPGYLDDPLNSLEQLIKETKLHSLQYYLGICVFALSMVVTFKDNLERLKYHLVKTITNETLF